MITVETRKMVVNVRKKFTIEKTAKICGVSESSVQRWSNNVEPQNGGWYATRERKLKLNDLKNDVEKYPDAYQEERAKRLGVSQGCISYNLKKLGITRKKKQIFIRKQKKNLGISSISY